jgi:S1-C subfamily serine protease
MKRMTGISIRLLVLLALLMTSAIAYAQDEAVIDDTATPFIGIRYWGVDEGLLVTGVIANTPADAANLQSGDVVTAVEGEAIQVDTVQEVVWKHAPGTTVTLSLDRDGAALEQDLTLMARPENVFNNPDYPIPLDLASVGLFVGECNGKLLVVGALANSEVASAGFQMYDRIVQIDGDDVRTIGEADIAVSDLSDGDELSFLIARGDRELTIKVITHDRRRHRHPRQRPPRRPHPRVESTFVTDSVGLGYGDGFIEIQALSTAHDLYSAGIRRYDLITAANGAPIEEGKDLFSGDEIALTVQRVNGTLHFDVPSSIAPLLMFGQDSPVEQDRSQWLGLHEKQVTLGVRYLQLEPSSPYFQGSGVSHGAFVAEVIEGLPAAKAGIRVGDIIVAVAGEPVTMEIDLRNRIYFHKPGDEVSLDVLREGEIVQVEVVLRVAS